MARLNRRKKWKQNQYEKQQGKCAYFGCAFVAQSPEYLEIDHIKPIATHPELSVNIKNLRLLCPPCNKRKGGDKLLNYYFIFCKTFTLPWRWNDY
ncbi:HNH endonuclease [Synechocystis sp. B12]|nr:HNH endonuclease [Synechocystis sp. B12]